MKNCLLSAVAIALLFTTPAAAMTCNGVDGYAADFGGRRTFLWRGDALESVKATITTNPAYAPLIEEADKALKRGPWSVTDKTRLPPSGDPHDYMSMAPYFWPDPSRPDGLPYVNRDGQVNPERSGDGFDRTRLGQMGRAVETLSLAYYYSGDVRYAERAALILRVWFLDPATRMNPNMDFAQGVPGSTPGRGYGIIDGVTFLSVPESVGLLAPSGVLSAADTAGLKAWFGDFSTWLTTSDNGRFERATTNNHAVFYDLQLTQYALFSGNIEMAKDVLSRFGNDRLKTQMAPDGTMPRELVRTRSFHYATWVLQAAYDVASLGECVDIDIWNWHDEEGRSLRKATDVIAAWSGREAEWPWQVIDMKEQDLYDALTRASRGYRDKALSDKARTQFATARTNLIFPKY